MANNPTIHNDGGVHRFIDYVSQIPDFLKAEDDVVVLLQVLSDYLNNAYRNISTVEKFEFKFIAIESNLSIVQKKAFDLINLFKQTELRSNKILFLSKPEGNPYTETRPLIMEYIRYSGDISSISNMDGILNSDIITQSIRNVTVNGDKFFVKFIDVEFDKYSGVYYYDADTSALIIDPNSSSQDPFNNTPNEPISSVVGWVPRMIEFNVSDISEIHTRKAATVNDLIYYTVSFTSTISNVTNISSVINIERDIDLDSIDENILIDYYDAVNTIPNKYDDVFSVQFGKSCDNFDWTYGYGKGLFYARELTKTNILSPNTTRNYNDPIYASNTRDMKIIDIMNATGNYTTVTLSENHYLSTGNLVYISGTSSFNGKNIEIVSVPSTKSFTYLSNVIGHEYTGTVVSSDLFYSKLVDSSEKYKLKLNYSDSLGVNTIISGDVLYRSIPEYDVVSTTFNPESDLDVATQTYIVTDPDKFTQGSYVVATIQIGTVSYLDSSTVYKIVDKLPTSNGRIGLKLEGVGFTSVGTGSNVTLTRIDRVINENSFNTTTQTFTVSNTYGLNSGDIIRIIPLRGISPLLLSSEKLYTIQTVDQNTNTIKLNGTRFLTTGSNLQLGIVKYTINKNTACKVHSHITSNGVSGEIILTSVYGDAISKGFFIKNEIDSIFPVMVESASNTTPWVSSFGIIYTKGSHVYYDKKQYRVLRTHTSGNISIINTEYFVIDMGDVIIYDKKVEYNPYMNGMYSVKSLNINEEPDYSVGFDKLYSDLYIKKVQDLSLKYGHEQRQFVFDPRVAPSNILNRTGFMEIIKGSGDYDAVDADISSYVNATTVDSMLLRGADWELVADIALITSSDGVVTVKTTQIHHLQTGIYVTINNLDQSFFNGRHQITVISPYLFTYTVSDLSNIIGTYSIPPTAVYNNDISCEIESINRSGTNAVVVTTIPHGYQNGITVTISGAIPSGYNGEFIISVYDDYTFTYQVSNSLATPATSADIIKTTYIPNVGDYILVDHQYNPTQNGIYVVDVGEWKLYDTSKISIPVTFFSKQNLFDISSVNPSTSTELDVHVIQSMTYLGLRVVSVELYDTHDYSIGTVVTISGAAQSEYNGKFEISDVLNSHTFQYLIKGDVAPSTATPQPGLSLLARAETWYKYEITDIEWQQKSNYNNAYIGFSIANISGNGTLITVNTSIPTDYYVGDTITISNTTNYNGTFSIYNVINSTTFTISGNMTSTELNGNVYKGIVIESNQNKDNVANLYGEYKFSLVSGDSYMFNAGDIVELKDQFITRENGIYRVQSTSPWTRLDKKLVLKITDITIDARENDDFDSLEEESIPYVYSRFSDSYVNSYISDHFDINHQIYKIDGRFAINYSFVFEKIDNIDTSGQLHLQYDSRYDYNSISPRVGMDKSFVGVADMTYPLIEKFERLAYLKDPKVIDLSLIEYLARFMGYDITELKSDIDESVVYNTLEERENALRETIQNLPQYYALKGTESSLEMLLLTFGIVGKLVTYWTRQEDPYNELIPDYDVRGTQIAENIDGKSSNFIPTPHFKIKVEIESNFDNQILDNDSRRITNQIHKFKPINTVFDGIYRFLECKASSSINISNMRACGKMTSHVGFDDIIFDDLITNDCFDGASWNIQSDPYLVSISSSVISGSIGTTQLLVPVFSDGNAYECEWKTTNSNSVTVDEHGFITCIADGSAIISCTYQYITLTCSVYINNLTLQFSNLTNLNYSSGDSVSF